MSDIDRQFARAIELGHENAETIELAHHHCTHMAFEHFGGYGMAEAGTGLPIDMRQVRCPVAIGSASGNLRPIAADFYREHCGTCKMRAPTGVVPNLATVVADADAAQGLVQDQQRVRLEHLRAARERRVELRRALASATSTEMAGVLSDVDVLDDDPAEPATNQDRTQARERIGRLADRSPELFTNEIADVMVELVTGTGVAHDLLDPLRRLARGRPPWAQRVAAAAAGVLQHAPSPFAGPCVAELIDIVEPDQITDDLCRSLVMLAGAPVRDANGLRWVDRANDPSGLQAVTQRDPDRVVAVLRSMLPPPTPRPPLVLPPRLRHPAARVSSTDRAAAANATRALLFTSSDVVAQLVPTMVTALAVEPDDTYDDPAAPALQRTLAHALVLDIGDVIGHLEAAASSTHDEEFRAVAHGVLERAARLVTDNDRQDGPELAGIDDERRAAVVGHLLTCALARVHGDWGDRLRTQGAELVERLSRAAPQSTLAALPGLLGSVLALTSARDQAPASLLHVTSTSFPGQDALERLGRTASLNSATHRVLQAVRLAANADAGLVCREIVTIITNERDGEHGSDVVSLLLRTLGEVARDHGDEPGVLRTVLPVLHGYVVDEDVWLRSCALEAWIDVAAVHAVPASVQDLLPALLADAHLVVINAVLRAALQLSWAPEDRLRLLHHATLVMNDPGAQQRPETIKLAIATVGALARDLGERVQAAAEAKMLETAAVLDSYDLAEVLRRTWLPTTQRSDLMARLRLRQAADPQINDRLNSHDDDELRALLQAGPGLQQLQSAELTAPALELSPGSPRAAAEFAEVAWRVGNPQLAADILNACLTHTPDNPAHRWHRVFLRLLEHAATVDAHAGTGHAWDTDAAQVGALCAELDADGDDAASRWLTSAATAAIRVRQQLTAGPAPLRQRPGAARDRATALADAARALGKTSNRATETCAYLRLFADAVRVAVHLVRADAAVLRAKRRKSAAHITAAHHEAARVLQGLSERFAPDDPLAAPLVRAVTAAAAANTSEQLLVDLAALPIPVPVVRGRSLRRSRGRRRLGRPGRDRQAPPPIAVVLGSVDGQPITGPEVLRPSHVYNLTLDVHTGPWPPWADRLDAELVSHLTPADVTIPDFSWPRSAQTTSDTTLSQTGTLLLRFALGAGQPAPEFVVRLTWRGTQDGDPVSRVLDVTGHRSFRLRPYDSTRDRATHYPMVDERLLAIFDRLYAQGYDDDQVQAFGRLLTSVCRAGLRMTWERKYKRGAKVAERSFHDDLHARLLADPELGGRVERGTTVGLGFVDVRHDGITAELKVERTTPVTADSARKYIGQPTQYAAADGTRLAILVILDVSPKRQPVGSPENYLFTLAPDLHGLEEAEAPSLVAAVVVNVGLPSPSSWSRRKIAITDEPD